MNSLQEKIKEKDKRNKNIFIAIFVGLIILDISLWFFILKDNNHLEIDFLNVGQGDATLLKFPHSGEILIDSGDGQQIKTALAAVNNYFKRQTDVWILSHANIDHYGGFLKLMETNPPQVFIYSGFDSNGSTFLALKKLLVEKNIPVIKLSAGDKIKIGEAYFLVLWPPKNKEIKDLNDASLILRLIDGKHSILFSGDASSKILDNLINIRAEILKVSHHGSKTATDENILQLVNPSIALIGVGLNNSFHHPNDEVINLLKQFGVKIFRTDLNGTIKIILANQILIKSINN